MVMVINGSGISGLDGSTSAPTLQGTDTNTGIYFPAVDTVGVVTNGTERLRVDSSGNVGIGMTPAGLTTTRLYMNDATNVSMEHYIAGTRTAYLYSSASGTQLGTKTSIPLVFMTGDTERMRIDSSGYLGIGTSSPTAKLDLYNAAGGVYSFMRSSAGSLQVGIDGGSAGYVWLTPATSLVFGTNSTERMRIDSSGNVGIGTTNPIYNLQINGTGTPGIRIQENTSGGDKRLDMWVDGSTAVATIGANQSTQSLAFQTVGSERMRIVSDGTVLINTNSAFSSGQFQIYNSTNSTTYTQQIFNNYSGSGSTYFIEFLTRASGTNTQRGIIHWNGTSLQYNSTSDARLKKDLGIVKDTSVIDNTVIHDFEWKENNIKGRGIFAQEAYEVIPSAIFKGGDELNDNGMPVSPWGVDYSKYVPDIIVYCQQLKATINELKAEFDAYKASHP